MPNDTIEDCKNFNPDRLFNVSFANIISFLAPNEIGRAREAFGKKFKETNPLKNDCNEYYFLIDLDQKKLSVDEIIKKYQLTRVIYDYLVWVPEKEYRYMPQILPNTPYGLVALRHGLLTFCDLKKLSEKELVCEHVGHRLKLEKLVLLNTSNIAIAIKEKLLDSKMCESMINRLHDDTNKHLDLAWDYETSLSYYCYLKLLRLLLADNALEAFRTVFRKEEVTQEEFSSINSTWPELLKKCLELNQHLNEHVRLAILINKMFCLFSDSGLCYLKEGHITQRHILELDDLEFRWLIFKSFERFAMNELTVEDVKFIVRDRWGLWDFRQGRIALGFWRMCHTSANYIFGFSQTKIYYRDPSYNARANESGSEHQGLALKVYELAAKIGMAPRRHTNLSYPKDEILGAILIILTLPITLPLITLVFAGYIVTNLVGLVIGSIIGIFEYPLRFVLGKDTDFSSFKKPAKDKNQVHHKQAKQSVISQEKPTLKLSEEKSIAPPIDCGRLESKPVQEQVSPLPTLGS